MTPTLSTYSTYLINVKIGVNIANVCIFFEKTNQFKKKYDFIFGILASNVE